MKHKLLAWLKVAGVMAGVGAALAVPFCSYHWGGLVLVSLVPLLFTLEWLEGTAWSRRRKVWFLYGIGLVFFGIIVQWMYRIHATDLIADNALRTAFIMLSFFLVASSLALGFIVFGWLYNKLGVSLKKSSVFYLLPALWVLGEYTRSVVFSIMWLGPGGSVGSHWNFGNLGFAASAMPLIFASRLVGLFGLSAIIVLINLSLYMLLKRRFIWQSLTILSAVACLGAAGYLLYAQPANSKNVRIGVAHLQSEADTGYETDLLNSIRKQRADPVHTFVLPEYSHFYEAAEGAQRVSEEVIARAVLGPKVIEKSKGLIITTQAGTGEYEGGNGVLYMRPGGHILSTQYKRFLIPAGEYVPYAFQAILYASGNSSVVSQHQTHKTIMASTHSEHFVLVDGVRYGAMACSGVLSPQLYQHITRSGAEVLINSASLSSMGIDQLYFQQARQMARFQSVANARAFVQSARGGQSYAINQNGSFIAQSQGDKTQYFATTVATNSRRTLYSMAGEWVAFVALGIVTFATVMLLAREPTKKHPQRTRIRASKLTGKAKVASISIRIIPRGQTNQ